MPLPPTLGEVLEGAILSRLADVRKCIPGRVKSYDGAKQTAEIIPVIRGTIGTEAGDVLLEDLPVLPNVPVCWMRGGGYSLQFPLSVGDHGLVVFSDASPALWRTSGETSEPGDLRMHDLSFGFFIPCCAPDAQALPSSGSAAVLDGPTLIRLGGTSADFVALAAKVDAQFQKIMQLFTSWTPVPQDGGAALKALTASLHFDSVKASKVKAE